MKTPLLLFAACSLAWSQAVALPKIGEKFDVAMRDGYLTVYGRHPPFPYVNRSYAAIKFQLAVDQDERLIYISTQDPEFKTPEQLRVGATSDEVFAAGGSAIVSEPGFPPHSLLPSGWCAQFPERPINCIGFSLPEPPKASLIVGFFKRAPMPA
ncbi:hypothetical protein [Geothrix sp. PMB-07]|uniref:hypothetical protein n=1 Tax=Geothrix sp. PMB-07 TaxID=3068640 RepID=UPI0027415DBA|nr:hypothetical protein [Geothrix sp. PMB-07]WLT32737.1 hypothetical protein Q9293_05240 [Geothrix sp. PMB-07]